MLNTPNFPVNKRADFTVFSYLLPVSEPFIRNKMFITSLTKYKPETVSYHGLTRHRTNPNF